MDPVVGYPADLAAVVLCLARGLVNLIDWSTQEAEVTPGVPQSLNSGTQHSGQQPCIRSFFLTLKTSAAIGDTFDWEVFQVFHRLRPE